MNRSAPLLQREQSRTQAAASWSVACVLTGGLLWLASGHSIWIQWTLLAHAVSGVFCAITLTPYVLLHLRRTLGVRRGAVIFTGFMTLPVILGFVVSGIHLMVFGQRETQGWILDVHVLSAALFVGLVAAHVLLHVTLVARRSRQGTSETFPASPKNLFRSLLVFNLSILLLVGAGAVAYRLTDSPRAITARVQPYALPYGEHPFRPSQTETEDNGFLNVRQIAGSERCGACHGEIAEQWYASAHREAASDPAYMTNINLLAEQKGISATRYCEGCHAPVALLTGELSPGGQHGGIPGTPGNLEGVSCLSCHGISAAVHLKGVASYELEPAEEYLFARSDWAIATRLHDWLLRMRPDQHKRDMARPILSDPRMCATCHAQFMDKEVNDWGWVKMQDEYAAWLTSPFSGDHEDGFSNKDATTCQECHMPLVASRDPSSNRDRMVRAHHFPGANTVLPLLRGDKKQLDATIAFLQSNRVRVNIDRPNREDARQTRQPIEEEIRGYAEAPYYYYLGETANLRITVSNHGVGHDFPGGTIDLGEAWIELLALDAEGSAVFLSGSDENGRVDPEAHFYRSLPVDRKGSLVWRHDLFNMVGESFRRVIPAGGSDLVEYSFPIPFWAKSPLTVSAILRYRKLNDRYARWALSDRYQPIPVVDIARDSLEIPIRIRREVE